VLFFFVIDFRIKSFVVIVILFAFAVLIISFFVELIMISFEIKLFIMIVRCMIFFFANNAHFNNDDKDVFNFSLRVSINFVKKRIQNESDDDHNERWFFQDWAIDTNVQKSINRVINIFNRIRLIRHDFVNLNIMLAILLEFRVKIQMKVQNEKIIVNRHVDNHFSNISHYHF
jgi:energy-coupling factor transporter transmembrane protein EcfT